MAPRFDHLKGVFGLLPTPYRDDYEILTADLLAAAEFCCRTGQHGIVWPVMVGEFYFLGEDERLRHLDALLAAVNGRLPFVFGCSGVSLHQVLLFARAAEQAGADAVIAMAPAPANAAVAMDMFRRLAGVTSGPTRGWSSSPPGCCASRRPARTRSATPPATPASSCSTARG